MTLKYFTCSKCGYTDYTLTEVDILEFICSCCGNTVDPENYEEQPDDLETF